MRGRDYEFMKTFKFNDRVGQKKKRWKHQKSIEKCDEYIKEG